MQKTTNEPDFKDYIAIDIEHNGSIGDDDQVLEVAAVTVCDGVVRGVFQEKALLHCNFNRIMAEKIGLNPKNYLETNLPSEETVLNAFHSTICSRKLVAHDIRKDIEVLDRRFEHYEINRLECELSDTKAIFESQFHYEKSNLENVANCLDIGKFHPHVAIEDAIMHAKVYERLMHNRDLIIPI